MKNVVEQDMEQLITLAPIAIISSDNNGRIVQFNKEAEHLLRIPRAKALKQNVANIYAGGKDTARQVMKTLRQTDNGQLRDHITELVAADGRVIPIALSVVLHDDDQGVTGYFRDLTEYRTALSAMFAVTGEVVSQMEETAVLQKIVDVLVQNLGYQVAYFRLLDADHLMIRAAAGTKGNYVNNPDYALRPGLGINGQVAATGEIRAVEDVTQSPDFHFPEMSQRDNLRSMLSVPVKSQDEVIGVLACYHAWPHMATEPEIHLVTSLANMAAVTLKRATLFSQERKHKEQLHTLFATGLKLTSSLELEETLKSLAEAARKLVDADGAYICLVDGQQLVPAAGLWRHPYHKRPKTEPRPNGLNYTVFREERAIFIEHVDKHPLYQGWRWGGAIAGLPLIYDQKILGVLTVAFGYPHTFVKHEKQMLQLLSQQAATAINKAHLVTRLKQEQLLMQEIQRTMDKMADRQATLEVILDGAIRLTKAERGNLALLENTNNSLKNQLDKGFPPGYTVKNHTLGDKSIQGQVAAQKISALISNVHNDPVWKEYYYAAGQIDTISELAVPIINQSTGDLVGVINLEHSRENAFSQKDLDLVQNLAIHASIALNNAHLYDKTKRHTDDLVELIAIGKEVSGHLRLEDVVDTLHQQLKHHFGTDITPVLLLYHEAEQLLEIIPSDQIDLPDRIPDSEWNPILQLHEGISGWVAQHRRPALVPDVNKDERYLRVLARTRSEIAVPIIHGDKLVGVLDIDSSHLNAFDQEDLRFLELVANQVAAAIEHAHQYEALDTRQKQLQALHTASKALANAGITLQSVLQEILNQAVAVTGAHFGSLQLLGKDNQRLIFEAAWPEGDLEMLRERFGTLNMNGRGITIRAIRERKAQLVPNVRVDPDYIQARESTLAELAVVLKGENGQPIGVLNVEHQQVKGFSEADRDLLQNFSNLAVAAIDNARKANKLSRTNEIAIMGAWAAEFFHDMLREVSSIRRKVYRLRTSFSLPDEINELLNAIDDRAKRLNVPFPTNLPQPGAIDDRAHCFLDNTAERVASDFQRKYPDYTLVYDLNCVNIRTAIHQYWLRRILIHLISNSIKAIPETKPVKHIKIATHYNASHIKVYVEDNGLGIEPNIEAILFKQPVRSLNQKGQGRGLLLVQFIVEQYGGRIELDWTRSGDGTRFLLLLPNYQEHPSS